jgi:DNA transposition AAA+ family ATPase
MINVEALPVDVEEMRDWANGYKVMEALSWADLGKRMAIPGGTLQPFCKGNYAGDNDRIAREIFKFRQGVQSRAATLDGIPTDPGYFETPTSLRIRGLLAMASTGEITLAAMGAGLGKTRSAIHYAGCVTPVYMATMDEATKRTPAMVQSVEGAIGLHTGKSWTAMISAEIIRFLRNKRATLIVDEANHLEYAAFEQLRAWHDATGVGICLLGNEELLTRIESGRQRDAFARLNSRIFQRLVQNMPEEGDVVAFCDAWKIFDPGMRSLLTDVALRPGSGALRECRQIVRAACLLASEDGGKLEMAHMRWAVDNRARRIIR